MRSTSGSERTGTRRSPSPRIVVCADWSATPRARAAWFASTETGSVSRLAPPLGGWGLTPLLDVARRLDPSAVVGIDAPLGLPRSFLHAGGWRTFLQWLAHADLASDPVGSAEEWTLERPFVRPVGKGSWTAVVAKATAAGVNLRRSVDDLTRAETVFKLVGPRQVGGAARALWRELREARNAGQHFRLWPFETRTLVGDELVVAEVYPAAAYALVLARRPRSKRDHRERTAAIESLEGRIEQPELAAATEDDFDAAVTAAAALGLILDGRPLATDERIDPEAEGAILCV